MDERVGFTVEREPARRRWRLPALMLLLACFFVTYYKTRPVALISGQYDGFIGGAYSNNKTHLKLRLTQNGSDLKGDCVLSHQTGRAITKRTANLTGKVSTNHFEARGVLNNQQLIVFEGEFVSQKVGGQVQGQVHFESGDKRGDTSPFLGRFQSAYSAKQLLNP
ncbi:hypothetical protein IV102_14505 [bacterium]|nr:hypothetical protein [bacterium]